MSTDRAFWNKIAPRYAKSAIRDEAAYAYTLERVVSHLDRDQQVLELGCGTGTTAIKLAPNVARLTATDLAPAMLEIGKTRAAEAGVGNLEFLAADVLAAPQGPFDVVMGFNLFHLVEDLDEAMAGVAKRLSAGGLFISKTPCLADTPSALKKAVFRVLVPALRWIGKAPRIVNFLRIAKLEQAMEKAGFEIIETGNFPADPPSRFIVARRL